MYLLRYYVKVQQQTDTKSQRKSVSHSCYVPLANQLGAPFCVTAILTLGPKPKEHLPSEELCGLSKRKRKKSSCTLPCNSSTQRWGITLPLTLDWPKQNPSGHGSALLSPSGERVYKWAKWLPRLCVLEASPQQDREIIFRPVKAFRAHSSTLCSSNKCHSGRHWVFVLLWYY